MHETSFEEALATLTARDQRYHREAYIFIREALDHTQKLTARDAHGRIRHVTDVTGVLCEVHPLLRAPPA